MKNPVAVATALLLGLLGLFTQPLVAAPSISVHAEVDSTDLSEGAPLQGLISITHPRDMAVDPTSFKIDKRSLPVELVKEEPMTAVGDLQMSIFRFALPAQPKGAYSLPPIAVMVAGREYRSIPTTYQVRAGSGGQPSAAAAPAAVSSPAASRSANSPAPSAVAPSGSAPSGIVLQIENVIQGPTKLYPGQRTTIGYNYLFNVSLETTAEDMPLLQAEGMTKVGEKIIKEAQGQGLSLQQVLQVVQADKSGTYTFGPSFLEGTPYTTNRTGQRIYGASKLRAQAPAVTIEVLPFPAEGKPPSFNGALGQLSWHATLLTPADLQVGNELVLRVEVSGSGDLEGVPMPELCCQPGMSGAFKLSDLQAPGGVEGSTKHFDIKMRVLNDQVREIPSLEFSSFDPTAGKYLVDHTAAIPLSVKPGNGTAPAAPKIESAPKAVPWPAGWNQPPPSEIGGNYPLKSSDIGDLWFSRWWVLLIVPFALALMIFQFNLKRYLQSRPSSSREGSRQLLERALVAPMDSAEQHHLLQQALIWKLVEIGELSSLDVSKEQLGTSGIQGKVRTFLMQLDERRYAFGPPGSAQSVLDEGEKLYGEIDRLAGK